MWKAWYELTKAQKLQALDLDGFVRQSPSEYEYCVDDDGDVVDYRHLYD